MSTDLTVLLPIELRQLGGQDVNSVSARDLHAALGVKRDFSNWFRDQVTSLNLVEGRDFCLLALSGEQTGRGGHNRKEYAVLADVGKKVGMATRTEKGDEVREYFLACERKALAPMSEDAMILRSMQVLQGRVERLTLKAATAEEGKRLAEAKVVEAQPAIDFKNLCVAAKGDVLISVACTALNLRHRDVFTWLRSEGHLYKRQGTNIPSARMTGRGLMILRTEIWKDKKGVEHRRPQTYLTSKGYADWFNEVMPDRLRKGPPPGSQGDLDFGAAASPPPP